MHGADLSFEFVASICRLDCLFGWPCNWMWLVSCMELICHLNLLLRSVAWIVYLADLVTECDWCHTWSWFVIWICCFDLSLGLSIWLTLSLNVTGVMHGADLSFEFVALICRLDCLFGWPCNWMWLVSCMELICHLNLLLWSVAWIVYLADFVTECDWVWFLTKVCNS